MQFKAHFIAFDPHKSPMSTYYFPRIQSMSCWLFFNYSWAPTLPFYNHKYSARWSPITSYLMYFNSLLTGLLSLVSHSLFHFLPLWQKPLSTTQMWPFFTPLYKIFQNLCLQIIMAFFLLPSLPLPSFLPSLISSYQFRS